MSIGHFTPQRKGGAQSQKKDPLLLFEDAAWLSSLSEPQLDFLGSLKRLIILRSKLTGHRDLVDKFDVRRLHALGVIVLEFYRENWKSIPSWAMDSDLIDNLPFLTTRIVNANLDNETPSFGTLKRKHFHDGLQETVAESSKKQKMTVKEEPVEY